MNGYLFVFEGADGVGKTTIIDAVYSELQGKQKKVRKVGFPGYRKGTLGDHIYQVHNNPDRFGIKSIDPTSLQLLHIASHVDSINREIIPALDKDEIILLDRYWWSTYVYGKINGVEEDILKKMIEIENFYWKDYIPSKLFLIKRGDKLLKKIDNYSTWLRLKSEYDLMLKNFSFSYPVIEINNEFTIHKTVGEIFKEITDVAK